MQYRRGGGGFGSDIFKVVAYIYQQGGVGVCGCCKCRRYGVKVRRCGDTFHPPEKLTLYLKVTPFDSNTPTHFNTKVPIGGYLRRC